MITHPLAIPTFILLMIAAAVPSLARATDWTPQTGLWIIDEEDRGKPGRGFQIEVQNDVLVLTNYGYEANGDARYWLAAGVLKPGSNQITMNLDAFEGGMAFGDPVKDATHTGSEGQVTLRFTSHFKGEICLPNESCKPFSAFNYGFAENASRLLGGWRVNVSRIPRAVGETREFIFLEIDDSPSADFLDVAKGFYRTVAGTSVAEFDVLCGTFKADGPWQYYCEAETSGQLVQMTINVERDSFYGQTYDADGEEPVEYVFGTRLRSATGRQIFPD